MPSRESRLSGAPAEVGAINGDYKELRVFRTYVNHGGSGILAPLSVCSSQRVAGMESGGAGPGLHHSPLRRDVRLSSHHLSLKWIFWLRHPLAPPERPPLVDSVQMGYFWRDRRDGPRVRFRLFRDFPSG